LGAEKRIPEEVFEGFKRTTSSGGYVVVAISHGKESASGVFLDNGCPLGRDGYPHALVVPMKLSIYKKKSMFPMKNGMSNLKKWW